MDGLVRSNKIFVVEFPYHYSSGEKAGQVGESGQGKDLVRADRRLC